MSENGTLVILQPATASLSARRIWISVLNHTISCRGAAGCIRFITPLVDGVGVVKKTDCFGVDFTMDIIQESIAVEFDGDVLGALDCGALLYA
ncbi:MAG: hypothetical protein ACLPY1_06100 [Terracidiphilus sp.]